MRLWGERVSSGTTRRWREEEWGGTDVRRDRWAEDDAEVAVEGVARCMFVAASGGMVVVVVVEREGTRAVDDCNNGVKSGGGGEQGPGQGSMATRFCAGV